jgi:TRAP transporter TAXI family solute receptor
MPPKPDSYITGAHELGTTGHLLVSLFAETMIEKLGIPARVIPISTYLGRAYMSRLGQTHTTIDTSAGTLFLQEGLFEYSGYDWGPQPVRYLHLAQHVGWGLAVNADSDIYTAEDLKGKTFGYHGSAAVNMTTKAMMAFFNLTEADVKIVHNPSSPGVWRSQIEGKIDTSFWNVVAALSYELEATRGIRWIPMPADDKEGWARARKVIPCGPRTVYNGAGITPDNPAECGTFAYPCLVAYDILDPDIAYWITKASIELYDDYAKKHDSMRDDWTVEAHWALWESTNTPLHEGAIRYFKEAGMWNDEREKMQQANLKHQADLKALWDKTVDEAVTQKISARDFPAFWMQARAIAGFD